MKKRILFSLFLFVAATYLSACKKKGCTDSSAVNYNEKAKKDDGSCEYSPKLIFKFKFDPDQERLGNSGQPQPIPQGHAAQTPQFNLMGAHYIELSKQGDIPAYNGTQVYKSPVITAGGEEAIVFNDALYGSDGDIFYETELKSIPIGVYKYLRISLSYQNYEVMLNSGGVDVQATIASFVGANSYINSFRVKDQTVTVNGNKKQGYWALETNFPNVPVIEGQAPEGATTVPNPLYNESAIPIGSCLVTGQFANSLEITGNETEDITIVCSISINNSFEWIDSNNNGIFEPDQNDTVVDMGTRGLIPIISQ